MTFTQKVLQVVGKIPKGKVLTYKQVAKKAGSERAMRAVGIILGKNCDKNIPCHRVIKSDGSVGEYNFLLEKDKKAILESEGVQFRRNGKVIF